MPALPPAIAAPKARQLAERTAAVETGAIVVSNAGGTLIIDGTSNMFKIAASGTLTVSGSGAGTWTTTATLSGTGLPGTDSPAFLAFVGAISPSNADREIGKQQILATGYVAPTSGASPVNPSKYIRWQGGCYGTTNGTDPQIVLFLDSAETGTHSFAARYHLLREAGI